MYIVQDSVKKSVKSSDSLLSISTNSFLFIIMLDNKTSQPIRTCRMNFGTLLYNGIERTEQCVAAQDKIL